MKKLSAILVVLLALGFATLAQAQATRTWVSGVGDDANPCSRTAPCKTFAGAISKTASPGIINCLDPGGFGAVTITKEIQIDCTGTLGSILHSGVQGVIVNASTTHRIILRNIDISGAGTTLGTNSVNIIQAGSVAFEGVNIETISGNGIQTTNTTNALKVYVDNTHIRNCGGNGILDNSGGAGGTGKIIVSNSVIENNVNGIDIGGANNVGFVFRTEIAGNSSAGFQVEQSTSGGFLEDVNLSANATGVQAGIAANTPTVRLSRCSVWGNTTAGLAGSGATKCFSNNTIVDNTAGNTCSQPNLGQQ